MSKKVTKGILAVVFMAMCLITLQPQKAQAAQEIPIRSADDLRQMENNPSGSYYLTKDITVPANTVLFKTYEVQFTGTIRRKMDMQLTAIHILTIIGQSRQVFFSMRRMQLLKT